MKTLSSRDPQHPGQPVNRRVGDSEHAALGHRLTNDPDRRLHHDAERLAAGVIVDRTDIGLRHGTTHLLGQGYSQIIELAVRLAYTSATLVDVRNGIVGCPKGPYPKRIKFRWKIIRFAESWFSVVVRLDG